MHGGGRSDVPELDRRLRIRRIRRIRSVRQGGQPHASRLTPSVRRQCTARPHWLDLFSDRKSAFCASPARGSPRGQMMAMSPCISVERSAHGAPPEGRPSHVVRAEQVGRGGPAGMGGCGSGILGGLLGGARRRQAACGGWQRQRWPSGAGSSSATKRPPFPRLG